MVGSLPEAIRILSPVSSSLRPAGVLVPLVTPFDERGAVDLGALGRLAEQVLDCGARGIVALATTGEPTSLDDGEREAVVGVCSDVCVRREAVLIVGAGTNDTRTTILRHEALAAVAGVAASLAVVPYYVRPSETAIVRHFQAVAARSPVPLIAYNIPYRTGRGLGAVALLELAATANIAGVKQAVGCIDADTLRVLSEAGDDFALLGGDDAFLFPLMLMGARGAIAASANLCTRRFVEMIECGLRHEVEAGRGHAEALLPLVQALFAEPSPAVIKALLHAQGRIPTAAVRMPLADASPETTARALEASRRVEA
jgi:4-hydroxy-tetrahydrodipicolinate synthase